MASRAAIIARDQRGTILIVALPMALILAGCLWYLASVGEAVLYRERLQDAADATAFESAVLHARGMNTLATLNMLGALVSAVSAGNATSELVASSARAFSAHASAAASAPAASAPELPGRARQALAIISELERGVAAAAPLLATVVASEENAAFYGAERAADEVLPLSYALLPSAADQAVETDPTQRWQLRANTQDGATPRLGALLSPGGSDLPSLPVEALDAPAASVWRQAENGNVMLQVWAVAKGPEPRRQAPLSGLLRFGGPELDRAAEPVALAQAEYYFACSPQAPAWTECGPDALWTPGWSARMRRFWTPAGRLGTHTGARLGAALTQADALIRGGARELGVRGRNVHAAHATGALSLRELFAALSDDQASWIH